MKTRNTITRLIAIAIAAAILVGASWSQPVEAQLGDGSVRSVSYASIGIVRGEKVRVSVANTAESGGTLTLSFQYYIADGTNSSSSVPFYESGWMTVPPGEVRSSGVSREDLNTVGEPGTGRAQMMVKVTTIAPAGSDPEDFPSSLEVIKDEGESVQTDSKYRLIILAAKRSKLNAPVSLIPGQRLNYNFFNPNEEGSQPVRVQASVYDSYGNLLRQTGPVVLQPGKFHTFSFNWDDLRVAGEEGTGRVQVRAGVQVLMMDGSVRSVELPASVEIVNKLTGRTVMMFGGPYSTGYVKISDDGE